MLVWVAKMDHEGTPIKDTGTYVEIPKDGTGQDAAVAYLEKIGEPVPEDGIIRGLYLRLES